MGRRQPFSRSGVSSVAGGGVVAVLAQRVAANRGGCSVSSAAVVAVLAQGAATSGRGGGAVLWLAKYEDYGAGHNEKRYATMLASPLCSFEGAMEA
jgi:hypothetical protein